MKITSIFLTLIILFITLPTLIIAESLTIKEITPTNWINENSVITIQGDIISTSKYIENNKVIFKAYIIDQQTGQHKILKSSYDQTPESNLNPLVHNNIFALQNGGAMIFDHSDIGSNYIRFWYWDGSKLSEEYLTYLKGCTSQNIIEEQSDSDASGFLYKSMVYEQNDVVYFFVNQDCNDHMKLPFVIGVFDTKEKVFNVEEYYYKKRRIKYDWETSPSLTVTQTDEELVVNGNIEITGGTKNFPKYTDVLWVSAVIQPDKTITLHKHKKFAGIQISSDSINQFDRVINIYRSMGIGNYISDTNTSSCAYSPSGKNLFRLFQDYLGQIIVLARNDNEYRDPVSQYFVYQYTSGALVELPSFTVAKSEPVYYGPSLFQTETGNYGVVWEKFNTNTGSRLIYSSTWDGYNWSPPEAIHKEKKVVNAPSFTTYSNIKNLENNQKLMIHANSYNFFNGSEWGAAVPLFSKYPKAEMYRKDSSSIYTSYVSQKNQQDEYLVIQNIKLKNGKLVSLARIFNTISGSFTEDRQIELIDQWSIPNIITDPAGETWYINYKNVYKKELFLKIAL